MNHTYFGAFVGGRVTEHQESLEVQKDFSLGYSFLTPNMPLGNPHISSRIILLYTLTPPEGPGHRASSAAGISSYYITIDMPLILGYDDSYPNDNY